MIRYNQRRYGEAQQFFVSALQQRPDFAPAILNLAIMSQVRFQDNQTALQRYRQYLSLKPRPANADAVAGVVRQLEEQMRPPPVPAPAHAPTQLVPAPNINTPETSTAVTVRAPSPPSQQSSPRAADTSARPVSTTQVARASTLTTNTGSSSTNSRFAYNTQAKPAAGNRTEAERLFAQGLEAQKAHRLADAITAYRAATQLDSTYFQAFYNLGLAASDAGNLQQALSAYENALAITPDSVDARYNFGLLLKQAGYDTDAANELEKLVLKHPNEARGHLALANLYAQQLHDNARARDHYLKVLELDPANAQANDIRRWVAEHPQ
jgi:tetratricopeptide (TPR) repeat protein